MRLRRLVFREMTHRKASFSLAVLSVAVALGSLVGAEALLTGDRIKTERMLVAKAAALDADLTRQSRRVEAAGQQLEEAIRQQMLGLGFNLLILPQEQDIARWQLAGELSATMPQDYADRLAKSDILTINHLLPTVTGRVEVRREDLTMQGVVQGTRGEIPLLHRAAHPPLLDAVAPGEAVVGHQVARTLGAAVGDALTIAGETFLVTKLHPERGSADDVTVWIDLAQAQRLLGLENLLHAILALECGCVGDRISQVRADVAAVLPGVQVIERYSTALARAEARAQAKATAEQALAAERARGERELQREREAQNEIYARHSALAAALVPLAMIAAGIWIGVLALSNVRQRTAEIGLLRALGMNSRRILLLFIARTAAVGLSGGVLGAAAGWAIGVAYAAFDAHTPVGPRALWGADGLRQTLLLAPLAAVALAIVASWIPILGALRQDPATALQTDS